MSDPKINMVVDEDVESNEGLCKLTGKHGTFARSHIIPRALTRLSAVGERMIEVGFDLDSKKRYDSWFDTHLVIREGEKILEELDTRAIAILRKHKMLWSSWSGATKLVVDDLIGPPDGANFRTVVFEESEILQLFFLSLVWRSAASDRPELSDVKLADDILEDIRLRVLNKKMGESHDYPIHLHQLTTIGIQHNRTPLKEKFTLLLDDGHESLETAERVRIYFDGLVAHVHMFKERTVADSYVKISLGNGPDGSTIVIGRPYLTSRTDENIRTLVKHVSSKPNKQKKTKGTKRR